MSEFRVKCHGCNASIRYKTARSQITCPRCKTELNVSQDAEHQVPNAAQNESPVVPEVIEAVPVPVVEIAATNPYESPQIPQPRALQGQRMTRKMAVQCGGIWRHHNVMVFHKQVVLPDICLKSNLPANERLEKTFKWHPPALLLTICIGLVVYVVLAIITTKSAEVRLPLSSEWGAKRRARIKIALGIFMGSLASIFIGSLLLSMRQGAVRGASVAEYLILVGVVLLISAGIYASFFATILKPTKINESYVWLDGVNGDYLAQLPVWPE